MTQKKIIALQMLGQGTRLCGPRTGAQAAEQEHCITVTRPKTQRVRQLSLGWIREPKLKGCMWRGGGLP